MRPAVIVAFVLTGAVAHAAEPAHILVRPSAQIAPVNRLVFGNNQLAYQDAREQYGNRGAGIWDPEAHAPVPEYADLAREAGLSVNRWPGGCGVHYYNWKRTVGPLADRPDQQFGLPEFLTFCEVTGSIPILTVACYWGEAQDAADLVEYCNAPNDGLNPNGDEDWAAVRATDGHPEPWGVVWFEYGNETWHGGHRGSEPAERTDILTGEQYARRFLDYRAAMRDVDPHVLLGAVMNRGMDEWNRPVLEIAGAQIDFGILHTYVPGLRDDTEPENYRRLMEACVAADGEVERRYDQMNALVEEITGRTDLPWAITEYNGWFVGQQQSPPFRQCLANALRNAEHLRVMLDPRHRIALANFWQFANEYWGMVQGYAHEGRPLVKQANFYVYQLYAQHFGDLLVQSDVTCGRWDFVGGVGVPPRAGEPSVYDLYEDNLLPEDYAWQISESPVVSQRVEGDTLIAEFPGPDTNYYHGSIHLPAEPMMGYRVIGEIRTEGLETTRGAGFQVGDARGWTVTRSAANAGDVRGDSDWTPVTVEYVTLNDTSEITILTRRLGDDGGENGISGTVRYRLLSVQRFRPWNPGAVPDVSVNAATRADGSVTLMIVNTNLDEPVETTIAVEGLTAGAAQAWSLIGPEPWSHNFAPETLAGGDPPVTLVETPVSAADEGWAITLPKHSLTAVEIRP